MAKRVKFRKLVGRPLMRRYRRASSEQREQLMKVFDKEKQAVIDKMTSRGFTLEAIVSKWYGVFTRGGAIGSMELIDNKTTEMSKAS